MVGGRRIPDLTKLGAHGGLGKYFSKRARWCRVLAFRYFALQWFLWKSIQQYWIHLVCQTQISSGVDKQISQNRMINLNSNEKHWKLRVASILSERNVKFVTSIFLSHLNINKLQLQFVEGTLWILSLLTLVFIHVLLMLFWTSLRISFFHIFHWSLFIRNDFTHLLFNVCSHYNVFEHRKFII